jgi:uncharacterized sulfatase
MVRIESACIVAWLLLSMFVVRPCCADGVRPNIVLIISDDQTYTDFGFMGHPTVQTPHLDALARQSAVFTSGYVPSSVCRPSLVTLLTGRYPHQHGVYFNHPPPGFAKLTKSPEIGKAEFDRLRAVAADRLSDQPTLPRVLTANGYRCLQTGKFWEGHFSNAGFTQGMTTAEPSGGKHGDKKLANGDLVAHGNGDHGLRIGRETMKPITQFIADESEEPFFIWYAPFLPHTPHDSPARYRKRYEGMNIADHQLPYFAAISQFDDTVGRLLKTLQKFGKRENTLVVFVVDNGWQPDPERFNQGMSEWNHTRRSKRAPFETGVRTPILFSLPGKVAPSKTNELVSSVDIVPTILTAAGIDAGIDFSGKDLWEVVKGKRPASPDRAVFGAIYPGDASQLNNPAGDVAYRWVRQNDLKLIVPHHHGKATAWNNYLSEPALFDVARDPDERVNLFGDQSYFRDRVDLMQMLNQWWKPVEH